MQKPTSEAIKEQVSAEVAEQLPNQVSELVVETVLKTSKKTRKGLANYHFSTEQQNHQRNCSKSGSRVCG